MLKSSPPLTYRPWIYFFIFLAANASLSYFHLPLQTRLWTGLLGLALPFLAAWLSRPSSPQPGKPLHTLEFLPTLPTWAWIFLGLLALFVRFYKLTTLSVWPHYDEGAVNAFALELSRKWNFRLFYGSGQIPPAFVWLMAAVYHFARPSLFMIWLVPALISLATIPIAYGACRSVFSKSNSFLCAFFLCCGFWGFFLGRFSFMTVLLFLMECLFLLLLGRFSSSPDPVSRARWAFLAGLGLGAGFYVHLHWLLVALLAVPFFFSLLPRRSPERTGLLLRFTLPAAVLLLPLLVAALSSGFGLYLRDLWAITPGNSPAQQASKAYSYLSCLFWGPVEFNAYSPFWGGFLNPVMDALFFLGAVELARNPRFNPYRWLAAALFFFFLPALLTRTVEPFRMVTLLPFLWMTAALGGARLFSALPPRKVLLSLVPILAFSFGLDFYHLAVPYHQVWNDPANWNACHKSYDRYQAFLILRRLEEKEGPGLIFSDFVPGNCDQTLALADDRFNAVQNPRLSPAKARWAAVLANANDKPFLEERFPAGKAYYLSKGESVPDGGWMLWVAPVEKRDRETFRKWRKASLSLGPFIRAYFSFVHGQSYRPVLASLLASYPAFRGDRLLETFFWELAADNELKRGPAFRPQAIQALQTGLIKGYPAAHLYYRLGTLWLIEGQPAKARQAFERAERAPFNLTDSRAWLERLGRPSGKSHS